MDNIAQEMVTMSFAIAVSIVLVSCALWMSVYCIKQIIGLFKNGEDDIKEWK